LAFGLNSEEEASSLGAPSNEIKVHRRILSVEFNFETNIVTDPSQTSLEYSIEENIDSIEQNSTHIIHNHNMSSSNTPFNKNTDFQMNSVSTSYDPVLLSPRRTKKPPLSFVPKASNQEIITNDHRKGKPRNDSSARNNLDNQESQVSKMPPSASFDSSSSPYAPTITPTASLDAKDESKMIPKNIDQQIFQLGNVKPSSQNIFSNKRNSIFTNAQLNRKRSNHFTPGKKHLQSSHSPSTQKCSNIPCENSSNNKNTLDSVKKKVASVFQNSSTPHHDKNRNQSPFMFSPSFESISKPPSELFSFDTNTRSKSPKAQYRKSEDSNVKDEDLDSVGESLATPFRFTSFPASLPRVRPRPLRPIVNVNDAIEQKGGQVKTCTNENKGNAEVCLGAAIEGRTLFSIDSKVESETAPPKTFKSSIDPKTNIPLRSPKALSGRYRSLDTSYDTSLSSISVNSPLSPRGDGKMQHRVMSPLLSRGSDDGMSLNESMEMENEEWNAQREIEKKGSIKEDFDLASPRTHDDRNVSGTKLNFNALSPELKNQDILDSGTLVCGGVTILKSDLSYDVRNTYVPTEDESSPFLLSHSFPETVDKNIIDRPNNIGTLFEISENKIGNSSNTGHEEFKYKLESTQCSPIHYNEESSSVTSPTEITLEKAQGEEYRSAFLSYQNASTSALSVSSVSSRTRKLRPMPDISAFEIGKPGQRRSSTNSKSFLSGTTSPLHLHCPPTPIRTPAWAHNESLNPSITRQDSLISSKVLAACPPELLDGFSSFENSLGDENSNITSIDHTPGRYIQTRNISVHSSHHEDFILPSLHEERNKFAKGRSGRFSTGSSHSFGSFCPPGTVRKAHPNIPIFRRDPNLSRSSGEVGASISFEGDFDNLGQLGSGNFADVYKARSRTDNGLYAIKKNRRQFRGKKDRENALAEVRTMQRLQASGKRSSDEKSKGFCPYLLLFIRAWQEDGYFFCQTEICCRENCRSLLLCLSTEWHIATKRYPSLLRNLQNSSKNDNITRMIPEQSLWKICHDVIAGLSHIHSHNLIHNDIKPSNIFFASHGRLGCICKIGDFGLAVDFNSAEDGHEGDTKYMPQELLSTSKKIPSADIFSFGVTLYELAASNNFILPSEGPKWHSIRSGKHALEIPDDRSQILAELIRNMIQPDPSKRHRAIDILHKVPKIKESGNTYDTFLSDYVRDVHAFDLERERELIATQREASLSRSTPTAGGFLQSMDRSWHTRTPTTESSFFSRSHS